MWRSERRRERLLSLNDHILEVLVRSLDGEADLYWLIQVVEIGSRGFELTAFNQKIMGLYLPHRGSGTY